MENKTQQVNLNPWKGLESYKEGEKLFGRNNDIQVLSQYIINNTQTVLYGKSGIGKTSILNAGVFPIAREYGLFPVAVRFEHKSPFSYVQQVALAFLDAGLVAREIMPALDPNNETLWEFFHRQVFINGKNNEIVQPLIVLDQFEEIFTLQQNEKRKLDFFGQLADLLNDVCPISITESLRTNIQSVNSSTDGEMIASNLEDFTFDIETSETETEGQAEYLNNPAYHIVVSMREDFLSQLERYTSYIPVMKNNRFGLLPLNEEQAAAIIMQPRPGFVEKNVAEHIIQKITGRTDFQLDGIPEIEVDAAVLSLYLSRLYEKRTDDDRLTNDVIDAFGDNIIKDFFQESIVGLDSKTIDLLETQLLTKEGRRNNVSRADLKTIGIPDALLDELIDDKKILRQFAYGDDIRVEFIHDILCPIVLQHKSDKEIEELRRKSEEEFHLKNRKRNKELRDIMMNALTPYGRRLLDNARDFGSFKDSLFVSPKYIFDYWLAFSKCNFDLKNSIYQINNSEGVVSNNIFSDENLKESVVVYEFEDQEGRPIHTRDGIYSMKITFDNKNISEVMFYGNENGLQENDDNTTRVPLYIMGGFCGIRIEYDTSNRVVSRTYLNDKGQPTRTFDNYAIVKYSYDDSGNPISVRYYDVDGRPCCHIQGNHGFNSEFDINGNEILRRFVAVDGNPTQLVSGVYGRRFEYYERRCLEKSIFNLDEKDNFTTDNAGDCGVLFEYDGENRVVKETYLDKECKPCLTEDGYAILTSVFSEDSKKFSNYYFGIDGASCSTKDGVFRNCLELDKFGRITSNTRLNANQQVKSREKYELDEGGFVVAALYYCENDSFDWGLWLEYNKTKKHVQKIGRLSSDGQKREYDSSDPLIFGYDFIINDEDDLPIISRSIDKNGNFIKNSDGFIGKRSWEDEKGRTECELYYDEYGQPMPANDGVFGGKFDYSDEERTMIITKIDKDQKPCSDIYGICCIKKLYEADDFEDEHFKQEFYYDINHGPCKDSSGAYGYVVTHENEGRIEKYISIDEFGNPMDREDGHSIEVTEYDEQGRIIKKLYLNKDGEIVPDEFGDYITFVSYEKNDLGGETTMTLSANKEGRLQINRFGYSIKETIANAMGQTMQESFYDNDNHLCINEQEGYARAISDYDEQGRIIYDIKLDEQLVSLQRPDGSFGYRYSYENGKTRQYYLDKDGKIGPCTDLYAIREYSYDTQGRLAEEHYYDRDGLACVDNMGRYGCLFSYKESDMGWGWVKIITNLNELGHPYVDNNGDMIIEITFDAKDRIVFEQTFDLYQNNTTYGQSAYGMRYQYDDEEHSKTTIYVDKNKERCATNSGICERKEWFDDSDRIIRVCLYDVDGNMMPFDDNSFIQEREYIDDHSYWTYFKDIDGVLMINKEGRAIEYVEKDDSGRAMMIKWYGTDHKPIPDEQGDYGISIVYDDDNNSELVTCLDEDGVPHINDEGYCHQNIMKDENGKIILRLWFDVDMNPIADEEGAYGWMFEYPEDQQNTQIKIYLDENQQPAPNNKGFVYELIETDNDDDISARYAYDINETPTFIDEHGSYGLRYIRTEDPNIVIVESLDENRVPFTNKKGFMKEIRTTVNGTTTSVFLDGYGRVVDLTDD